MKKLYLVAGITVITIGLAACKQPGAVKKDASPHVQKAFKYIGKRDVSYSTHDISIVPANSKGQEDKIVDAHWDYMSSSERLTVYKDSTYSFVIRDTVGEKSTWYESGTYKFDGRVLELVPTWKKYISLNTDGDTNKLDTSPADYDYNYHFLVNNKQELGAEFFEGGKKEKHELNTMRKQYLFTNIKPDLVHKINAKSQYVADLQMYKRAVTNGYLEY
ncbi:hypothetical protein PQ472_10735 [Lacticaseibacillus pabuli]|uniref:Lipoprotein n=1 Tax=Lacticaseibacillus pabuli TaxID=3025672 RepID=A0ABY7WQ85_9LACO|nr:hypothetical protein [Lacticaseibacillus sp. KACC 23028]WDF82352.1 hypothetical protein PQ472_10735 [Lacticaseibacillus sp. KACC 23028]